MSASVPAFIEARESFFSRSLAANTPSKTLKTANASDTSLAFLVKSYDQIQVEKQTIENAFSNLNLDISRIQSNQTNEQHRQFYLYCCELLETYKKKRATPKTSTEDFANYLHDNLGLFHAYRILLTFARLTDELLIRIMNDAHWFDKLNQSIMPIFDFDQSISILTLPVQTFFVLSFTLLGIRFLIELQRILKHTFCPTDAEKKELSAWERFCHELQTYRFSLLNDSVWMTFNVLGNHPAGNMLMFIGLCFDFSLLVYRYHVATKTYLAQKSTYEKALAFNKTDIMLKEQLRILELNQIEQTAALQLSLFAATLLPAAFTILLTASTPMMAPIGSFLCIVGTALYLSAGHYGEYQKHTQNLKQLRANGASKTNIAEAERAQEKAWNAGWSSFIKNTFLPMLFIAAIAIYWPVGLLLMAAYLAFELTPKENAPVLQVAPA